MYDCVVCTLYKDSGWVVCIVVLYVHCTKMMDGVYDCFVCTLYKDGGQVLLYDCVVL